MKIALKSKKSHRQRRHRRVRAKVTGTCSRPRVSVFRSNQHIYIQLIDDERAATILGLSDLALGTSELKGKKKAEVARLVGRSLGEKAKKSGISQIVFDRSGYRYHGRVKAAAEGLRAAGLKF